MYFFYIDESGMPESNDISSRFFVVCAIVLHKSQWEEFYIRFEGLKKRFFSKTYELHQSEVKGFNLVVKNKIKNRKNRAFVHQMINIYDYFEYPIFAIIIDKNKSKKPCRYKWLYPLCIQYLQDSIHSFLEDQGFDHNGILVLDEINPERSITHTVEHLTYKFGNPIGKTYKRIIEAPFFVDSRCSVGIQFADVFATIIRRQEELLANKQFCKFTDSLFGRIKGKAYETNKEIKGFKIRGYLKPFR